MDNEEIIPSLDELKQISELRQRKSTLFGKKKKSTKGKEIEKAMESYSNFTDYWDKLRLSIRKRCGIGATNDN